MQYDRHERVNFEREQRKIFKLYRRTNVLQRRRALEQRVMQPFGFFFYTSFTGYSFTTQSVYGVA